LSVTSPPPYLSPHAADIKGKFQKVSFAHYKIKHAIKNDKCKGKGKAIPLQALTGPEGSRRLKLPYFKAIGT
jgi:hypothetical protein